MQLALKIIISVAIILTATTIAKRFPSVAGLIAVMPLTGALVLVWVYLENDGNAQVMQAFTKGALWGIIPSILFFAVVLICLKKEAPLPVLLAASSMIWLAAAVVHQWMTR